MIVDCNYEHIFRRYASVNTTLPLLLLGDAKKTLAQLPDESIDCAMTSPPYWGKREYANGGIGLEQNYQDYIHALAAVFYELKRVLKPQGSLWLNIGDTFQAKRLVGIPWRVALQMTDHQGWILRNSIIWNKVKSGMDTTKDRLGNVHENLFHFVKRTQYYYDVDAVRSKPREAKVIDGAVISATGVSGVRYRRQIQLSTALSDSEKTAASKALDAMLNEVAQGRTSDFRMIIRGQQRTTHSDSEKWSLGAHAHLSQQPTHRAMAQLDPETLGNDLADHGRRPQGKGELQLQRAHAEHGVVNPFESLGIEFGWPPASLTRIELAPAAAAV